MSLRDKYIEKLELENDELRERVRILEEQVGVTFESPPQLMFTRSESVIFGLLLKNVLVSKERALTALYAHRPPEDEAEIKIVDVYVCKMRRKLKAYGIAIGTQWGQGYFMPADSKLKAKALLSEIAGEVAA